MEGRRTLGVDPGLGSLSTSKAFTTADVADDTTTTTIGRPFGATTQQEIPATQTFGGQAKGSFKAIVGRATRRCMYQYLRICICSGTATQ